MSGLEAKIKNANISWVKSAQNYTFSNDSAEMFSSRANYWRVLLCRETGEISQKNRPTYQRNRSNLLFYSIISSNVRLRPLRIHFLIRVFGVYFDIVFSPSFWDSIDRFIDSLNKLFHLKIISAINTAQKRDFFHLIFIWPSESVAVLQAVGAYRWRQSARQSLCLSFFLCARNALPSYVD